MHHPFKNLPHTPHSVYRGWGGVGAVVLGVLALSLFLVFDATGAGGITLTQRAYMFYNDDGSTIATGTARTSSATSTAITGVRRGERMNVRIQIDNGGTGSSTGIYRLQWENNTDAAGTWNDLGNIFATGTSQIRSALSDRGALAARWGAPPLPTIQVTSACSSSYVYTPGRAVIGSGTSTPLTIGPSTCTELLYSIDTTNALSGKTYRLRVATSTGGAATALDSYSVYPTFTTLSSPLDVLQVSKEARGITSATMLEGTGTIGGLPSLTIGTNGNPLIAHMDTVNNDLRLILCANSTCTATSGSMLEGANSAVWYPSLAIGTDGNPLIAHWDSTNSDLRLLNCTNSTCTATSASMLEGANNVGVYPSLTIGTNGNPLIAHWDSTNSDLRLLNCTNSTCTATSGSMHEGTNAVGNTPTISIGTDGYPIIAHQDITTTDLRFLRCTNSTCTATSGSMLEGTSNAGTNPSLAIGTNGNPYIAHYESLSGDLRLLRCTNSTCTATSGSMLEGTNNIGRYPSLTIGTNGNPLIAHQDVTNLDLRLLRCTNSTCTATSASMLEGANNVGYNPTISIGTDGNPIIAHNDTTNGNLRLLKCNSLDCAGTSTASAFSSWNASTTLRKVLDNKGYENILTADDVRDSVEGSANVRLAYMARTQLANASSSPLLLAWQGQLSVATATYMEIYNRASSRWDGVATNTTPSANTDFDLTATISNPVNYFDRANNVAVRVITGTTTQGTILSTDRMGVSRLGIVTQRQYAFYNDDGSTVATGTLRTGSATSTAISSVKKGERMNVRIQIDNSGTDAATTTYRLQWENNTDSPNVWNDLGNIFATGTSQIRSALSDRGALAARWGAPPLPTIQVTSVCSSSYTYSPGRFVSGFGTSTPLSLNPANCMEITYAIDTLGATAGKTYRLRLVTGSSTNLLDSYAVYPTFSMVSSMTDVLEISKEARGLNSGTMLEAVSNSIAGPPSLAIGIDGNLLIAHQDDGYGNLRLLRCTNTTCTATSGSALESTNDVGYYPSLAIGTDGNPLIAHVDGTNDNLRLLRCTNTTCTATSGSILEVSANVGLYPYSSLAISANGNPLIAHGENNNYDLRLLRCTNTTCTATSSSMLEGTNSAGESLSLTIGINGNPLIAHREGIGGNLRLLRCTNTTCTATSGSALESTNDVGNLPSISIDTNGNPLIAHNDITNANLRLLRCTNQTCTSSSGSILEGTNDVGNYASLAIGSDGNPVIAHGDATNANLRLLRCTNSTCTATSGSALEKTNGTGGHAPSLSIGTDGNPLIIFNNDIAIRLLKCNSLDCSGTSTMSKLAFFSASTTLRKVLDDRGYTNTASADDLYDTLEGSANVRMAYQARVTHGNNSDPIALSWEGQVSVATSTTMEIFNRTSGAWEVLATQASPTANTDFTLSGTQSSSLSSYYDAENRVSVRVITGTTTVGTTLKTDKFSMASPSLTERAYAFYNDDGSTVATGTLRAGSATSTPITSVKVGERLNARIQIDNAGDATSTGVYALQYENQTDAPGTWIAVGTGTPIRMALSQRGAMPARWGAPPLPTIQVTSVCSSSYTYLPGRFIAATPTSTPLTLGPSSCTEITFPIDTASSTAGKTYRLRLVSGTGNTAFNSYSVYPTLSILSSMTDVPRISKEARGLNSGTILEGTNAVGGNPSLAIGTDGNPLIAHYDGTTFDLRLLRCLNSTCTATSGSMLEGTGSVGYSPSLAIGTDGNALIAHRDGTTNDLRLLRCTNSTCTATSGSMLEGTNSVGATPSFAIGANGNPLVVHTDTGNADLRLLRCTNSTCTATSGSMLEGTNSVGAAPSLSIGWNGTPFAAHVDNTNLTIRLLRCTTDTCTATSGSALTGAVGNISGDASVVVNSRGNPLIAFKDDDDGVPTGDLKLVFCNDSTCVSKNVITLESANSVGYYPSLAIGIDSNPLIAHFSVTNSDLRLLRCLNSDCFSTSGSLLEGTNNVGNYPSLAIGIDGNALIAHMDASNADLRLLKCNSLDCSGTSTMSSLAFMRNAEDLRFHLDDTGYTAVATADDTYDQVEGSANVRIAYQTNMVHSNNTDGPTLTWEGQLSVATATYMEIYNVASSRWDGVATNTSPSANTDFTLSTTISSPTNYYDGANNIAVRVITGTTTQGTTLKTDQFTVTFGGGTPALDQAHFRFRADNGTEVQASAHTAEDTAFTTGLYMGDRVRLRFLMKNTGAGDATTHRYRLEVASSSCTVYVPVPNDTTRVGEHWTMDYSQYVPDAAVTTNVASLLTDPAGSFLAGYFMAATATTPTHTLTAGNFTEHEYSLRSTQYMTAGITYCFRLTNDGSTTNFTYTFTPSLVIPGGQRPQVGGGGVEQGGSGVLRSGGGQGGGTTTEQGGGGAPHGGGGSGGGGGSE